jgi:F0F1-type ATP synthase assembly protein I
VPGSRGRLTSVWAQIGFYSSLGFIVPAGAVGGYLVGWALDGWLHTTPVLAIVMTLLGVASGIFEVLRILFRAEKDTDGDSAGTGSGQG